MAREISSVRIRRLLRLALYLRKKGGQGAEVQDIISYCEYSNKRALQKDIKLLRDEYKAEITYKRSDPKRYCMTYEGELFILLSLNLNIKDITALSIGLGMAMHFVPNIRESCKDLWHKIANLIPEELLIFGEWLSGAMTMQNTISGVKSWVFENIINAIYNRQVIEIEYMPPYKKKIKTYKISSYDLFFKACWNTKNFCR